MRSAVTLPFSTPFCRKASMRPRPFFSELVGHLAHDHAVARLGADLGDARAHQAAAHDSDGLDRSIAYRSSRLSTIMAMPWPPPMQAVARP